MLFFIAKSNLCALILGTDVVWQKAIAMTNSFPPPDPSQSSQPRKPIVSFDEWVAIIVAFTTIGAILFWAWGGIKGKLFTQAWQKLKSTTAETQVLKPEINRRFDSRLSIDRKPDRPEVAVLPKAKPQPQQTSPLVLPQIDTLTGRKKIPSIQRDEPKPIIAVPIPSTPKTTETPTQPTTPTPPKTTETPTQLLVTFDDVPRDHWAYPFIEPLIEKKMIVGMSEKEFEPDLPITRAQLASEIEIAFRQETNQDLINFEDVSEESRIANKIDEAVKTGFLKGYPGQIFRPDQKVPRLQVLVALASGLDLKPSKDPATILSSYQDTDQIPDWAKEKIAAAIETGLVVNRPGFDVGRIYPDEFATRAEVVGMIYQGLVKVGRIEQISSPYIVPNR